MNTTDLAIELLLVEPSYNSAEEQVSTLRNAGMAIHPTRIDGEPELTDALQRTTPDLILCSADVDQSELKDTLDRCLKTQPDAALIILYKEQDPEILLEALRSGARDVVSKSDPEHLQLVVKREFGDLQVRRRLAQTIQRLQEAEARCSALIDHSRDAIAYIHDGMHVRANPVYLETFGYLDPEDLEGLPILDMIAPEDSSRFKKFLRSAESERGELEIRCQTSDGTTFNAVLEFSPARVDGEPCTEIIIRDGASNRQLEQKLKQVSSHDPQTGLYNKQYFMQAMEQSVAEGRESKQPPVLFYITINEFQKLRTEIGISACDTLLQAFAQVLKITVGDELVLARLGDHSFTILGNISSDQAGDLAERLHSGVAEHLFRADNKLIEPQCNIGIAQLNSTTPSSQEFINNAYNACIASRGDGADGTMFYDPEEMQPEFGDDANETRINELIQDALANDRFRLVFQPVVSLEGESREIYAVLTRLIDNNGEEILPDHFMGAANQGNLMAEVDRWVIRNALGELVSQREEGRKVHFFLTLSPESLLDKDFLLWLCDRLREQNAKGAWLTFQIREEDLRGHLSEAKVLVEGLKKIKCQIAVDQYGKLPKSEALLKHLPIDYVKFDRSLAEGIAGSQEQQDNLNQINREVQGYDIKTIVMGVEDANSLAVLWNIGVNYIQGYFLQEPSENISFEFTGT